jgi:mono/diheme cytochrome c family protein
MLKVVILTVLLAIGLTGVSVSGYGLVEKPELGGNGPLAIQMPPGLQAPAYHFQPSLEWWAERHGERVSSIGLNECLGCHKPETSCNNCHGYVGVKPIVDPRPTPSPFPTVLVLMVRTREPATAIPTIAPAAVATSSVPDGSTMSRAATAVPSSPTPPTPAAASAPSYANDIAPIIQANCIGCHDVGGHGGWNASSYEQMMNTGRNKPLIVPGNPATSLMIQKLTGKEKIGSGMPPFGPLTQQEIDLLTRWVAAGAPNN